MLAINIRAEDVARTRFACSALHETMASLRVLADPTAYSLHLPWLRDALPRLHAGCRDLGLLRSLVPSRGYVPDFITPPPDTPLPEFEAELERVRAVDPEQVRTDLFIAFSGHPPPAVATAFSDPAAGLRRLADDLQDYYALVLRHWWPAIQAALHADIHRRSRRLTDGGVHSLFTDLHPAIRWREPGRLTVDIAYDTEVTLDGRGVLLMPSAFTWPSIGAVIDPPWQTTLIYPAQGIANVWDRSAPTTPAALAAVFGATRAQILTTLEIPRSAGFLAETLGLSASAISQQVALLRNAGLVSTHRDGRRLICSRTPLADQLMPASAQT